MLVWLWLVGMACIGPDSVVLREGHILVADQPVASERLELRGTEVVRTRRYRFRVGETTVSQDLSLVATLAEDGRLTSLQKGEVVGRWVPPDLWMVGDLPARVDGPLHLPLWPDEAWQGPGRRWVPGEDGWPVPIDVSETGAWRSPHGQGQLEWTDGVLVADRSGPVVWRRGPSPTGPGEADLARLLGVPTSEVPRARSRRRLEVRFLEQVPEAVRVDPRHRCEGRVCVLTAPLPEELPQTRAVEVPEALAAWAVPPADPDGRLAALVQTLPGAEQPRRRLGAINHLVRQQLDVTPTPGVPDALAALSSGRGDCNEHASLGVALARAAGWPARVVTGLAYSEEGPGFYPHAWMEVWMGPAGWVPSDPVFGQTVADAARVPLVREGQAPLWTAIASIDEARFEIVAVR